MKVIDARTGAELGVGSRLDDRVVVDIQPGLFSASIVFLRDNGGYERVPLRVRWLHPGFLLQHIGFVPS